jgi:PAS domain S-box-containing protein
MDTANVNSSETLSDELKRQKDIFSFIIKSAPVGIGEISLNPPRFKWVNEATCNILGYTEKELLNINPHDLINQAKQTTF